MKMDKDAFIKLCVSSGYANKTVVKGYVKWTGRDEFTEEDFIEVYRSVEEALSREKARNKFIEGVGRDNIKVRRSKRYKQSGKMGSPKE